MHAWLPADPGVCGSVHRAVGGCSSVRHARRPVVAAGNELSLSMGQIGRRRLRGQHRVRPPKLVSSALLSLLLAPLPEGEGLGVTERVRGWDGD